MCHFADIQVASLLGRRGLSDAATPRFLYKATEIHITVGCFFFRPGSRNSQNTVGSLSQKVMKREEIVPWQTLTRYTPVVRRAASPAFPFRDGTSRYRWCNELDSSAPLRPSPPFVPLVSVVGYSVGNKRPMFLLSKHFALVKVGVPVSAVTTTSDEDFPPVFP